MKILVQDVTVVSALRMEQRTQRGSMWDGHI